MILSSSGVGADDQVSKKRIIDSNYRNLLEGKRNTIAVYSGDVGEARRPETRPDGDVSG